MRSNQRLDPLGIYGTRSAARLQMARRRKRLQQFLLGLLGIGAIVGGVVWIRTPRVPSGGLAWSQPLPFRPAAPPVLTSTGDLLLPTRSGQLRKLQPTAPKPDAESDFRGEVVFSSAFPLQAAPVVDGDLTYMPGQDGRLIAVNWKQNKVAWQVATTAGQTSSPVTVDLPQAGAVPAARIVVCGNDEGAVVAVNVRSGNRVWHCNAGGPVGQRLETGLIHLPTGAKVPVVLVPIGAGIAGRGGVVCLDARNGKPRWRFPRDGRAFAVTLNAPALDIDEQGVIQRVFLATDDGVVYALDAVTGRYGSGPKFRPGLWKSFLKPLPGLAPDVVVSLRGAPAYFVEQNLIVIGGNDGGVRGLDAATGVARWTFDSGSQVLDTPRLIRYGNRPAILIGSESPEMWAIDAETGRARSRWKLAGRSAAMWAQVLPATNELLVLDRDATLQSVALPHAN